MVKLDEQAGYRTEVKQAGGGGTDTFLPQGKYGRGTLEGDDARLSSTDSEVASLQDAWDWITEGPIGQEYTPTSVTIVLVSNIGPCDPCKERISTFRAMLVQHFAELQLPVNVVVEVVYAQSGGSAHNTTRGTVATTYGYANLPASNLPDGSAVWRMTVP